MAMIPKSLVKAVARQPMPKAQSSRKTPAGGATSEASKLEVENQRSTPPGLERDTLRPTPPANDNPVPVPGSFAQPNTSLKPTPETN
jgi:hypothetical protein